jgi:hypothetical protein
MRLLKVKFVNRTIGICTSFLMRWTSRGNAFTYVDCYETTRDGRVAFIALHLKYQGDDAKQAMITKAKNLIATAHFADSTSRFTIDNYCGRHITASNTLEKYGDPQTGRAQVHVCLRGIAVKHTALNSQILTNMEVREDLNRATIWFETGMKYLY